jgi:ABC-type maltose transport system permease subunit
MNATVQIPLISKLYKDISGNDLSALDAIALLIAIPVTIIFEVVHGKRPRDVPETAKL